MSIRNKIICAFLICAFVAYSFRTVSVDTSTAEATKSSLWSYFNPREYWKQYTAALISVIGIAGIYKYYQARQAKLQLETRKKALADKVNKIKSIINHIPNFRNEDSGERARLTILERDISTINDVGPLDIQEKKLIGIERDYKERLIAIINHIQGGRSTTSELTVAASLEYLKEQYDKLQKTPNDQVPQPQKNNDWVQRMALSEEMATMKEQLKGRVQLIKTMNGYVIYFEDSQHQKNIVERNEAIILVIKNVIYKAKNMDELKQAESKLKEFENEYKELLINSMNKIQNLSSSVLSDLQKLSLDKLKQKYDKEIATHPAHRIQANSRITKENQQPRQLHHRDN